jgi:hypothetical protein
MSNKPNVFPNKNEGSEEDKKKQFEEEKLKAANEIYSASKAPSDTPIQHINAVEEMMRRTEEQIKLKKETGVVIDPSLSETPSKRPLTRNEVEVAEIMKRAEEQIKVRDELLNKQKELIENYQKTNSEFSNKQEQKRYMDNTPVQEPKKIVSEVVEIKQPINNSFIELSQPHYNSPFDVIPLPSEGKLNGLNKSGVKVSYMTTSDENILTSPNLLKSGDFLSILINRKLLEPIRYKDLHVGDRNAIMIWLRATGYGEMYPITVLDEEGNPFDTEINLQDLKYKKLGAEPDSEGLFDFVFPLSKVKIKFRFLNCGDIDKIEQLIDEEKEAGVLVDNTKIYRFERMIVEVNGNRDRDFIKEFVKNIRLMDSKNFEKYTEEIESGVDLNITVTTPRGGSLSTFLPLNISFFWPDFGL